MVHWRDMLLLIDVLIIEDILYTKLYFTRLSEPWQTLLYIGVFLLTIWFIYQGWVSFKKDFKEKKLKALSITKLFVILIVLFVVVQLSVISATAISIYLIQPNFKLTLFYRQVLEVGIALLFLYPYMKIFEFLKSKSKFLKGLLPKQSSPTSPPHSDNNLYKKRKR